MARQLKYVIARTASHRPSLMHRVEPSDLSQTLCGLDMTGWSREYLAAPLDTMVCWRCEPARNPRKGWRGRRRTVTL